MEVGGEGISVKHAQNVRTAGVSNLSEHLGNYARMETKGGPGGDAPGIGNKHAPEPPQEGRNQDYYGSSLSRMSLKSMGWLSDCNVTYPFVTGLLLYMGPLMVSTGFVVSGN